MSRIILSDKNGCPYRIWGYFGDLDDTCYKCTFNGNNHRCNFSDGQCSYCMTLEKALENLEQKKESARFIW